MSRRTLLIFGGDSGSQVSASQFYIQEFIESFLERSGCKKLNLIVHSMGNRAITSIIRNILEEKKYEDAKIDNIILAAPDVDADEFEKVSSCFNEKCTRTTLYVSAKDRAIQLSRVMHTADRVGLTPPIRVYDGIDTINVGEVDLSPLGHGYIAEARAVLNDMYILLQQSAEPARRLGLLNRRDDSGQIYWEFRG